MSRTTSTLLRTLTSAAVTAGLLVAVQPAQALSGFLTAWQATYPGSTTDNSECALCHGTGNKNLNAYGKDFCVALGGNVPADVDVWQYLQAIEVLDSDSDPTESTNIDEINANAQPGWTQGAVNQIYAADVGGGCVALGSPISVPATIPLPYDPPVYGEPVAVPGGPYAGFVNVPITFDGSGSYDSDAIGEGIVSYAWDFGDGTTGDGKTANHTYLLADTYIVSLTVTDGEGETNTNSAIATISAKAVLDLDPVALKVIRSTTVGTLIAVRLSVENPGTVLGQALATVTGTQNGVQVYKWRLNVYDNNLTGPTTFSFPKYKPTTLGTINWAATITDVDPDPDLATATTIVK
jgi:PKD repeat protein